MLLFGTAAPTLAAEVQRGDSVFVGPDRVINDDLYAFGSNVQVLGTVNGNIFAAGNIVSIGGKVNGDVFAAGNTVDITGDVRHGVHAAGGTVTLAAPITEDAVVAGGTLSATPPASVGRDMMFAAGTANIAAPVERNMLAAARNLTLAAPVGGDVQAQVETLRLAPGGHVNGSVVYTSANEADVAPGAAVIGGIQRLQPQASATPAAPVATPMWSIVDWLKGLVGVTVIGLLLVLLLPRFSAQTVQRARTGFWSSLGIGFALFAGVPLLAVILFIVGIFLGGWYLGFGLLALYAMAFAVGYVIAAALTGQAVVELFRQQPQHLAWNLIEGLVLLGLVALVPVVGGLLLVLASMVGVGAVARSVTAAYVAARAAPTVATSAVSAPIAPQPVAA
jgi:cytoskeletal protein CcmA (bactofilin family)